MRWTCTRGLHTFGGSGIQRILLQAICRCACPLLSITTSCLFLSHMQNTSTPLIRQRSIATRSTCVACYSHTDYNIQQPHSRTFGLCSPSINRSYAFSHRRMPTALLPEFHTCMPWTINCSACNMEQKAHIGDHASVLDCNHWGVTSTALGQQRGCCD